MHFFPPISPDLHFICALCCSSSLVLQSLRLHPFPENILLVLQLDGILQRLAGGVIGPRLPSIQEDGWIWRNGHIEVRTGGGERGERGSVSSTWDTLKTRFIHRGITHTDQDEVQLEPNEVQSSFSPSVRCSWSSETAPLVIAGITTVAAKAGPPVVFIICEREGHYSRYHREEKHKIHQRENSLVLEAQRCDAAGLVHQAVRWMTWDGPKYTDK